MDFLKKHARLPRLAMESERYASVYSFLHKTPLDDCEAEPPAISVSALGGEREGHPRPGTRGRPRRRIVLRGGEAVVDRGSCGVKQADYGRAESAKGLEQ